MAGGASGCRSGDPPEAIGSGRGPSCSTGGTKAVRVVAVPSFTLEAQSGGGLATRALASGAHPPMTRHSPEPRHRPLLELGRAAIPRRALAGLGRASGASSDNRPRHCAGQAVPRMRKRCAGSTPGSSSTGVRDGVEVACPGGVCAAGARSRAPPEHGLAATPMGAGDRRNSVRETPPRDVAGR